MKNLSLRNITNACHGIYHGDESFLDIEVNDVVIDSRKVKKNDLFVAIDGVRVNAHKFIPDTIERGALCVVSHEDLGETDFPFWWSLPVRRFLTLQSCTATLSTSKLLALPEVSEKPVPKR